MPIKTGKPNSENSLIEKIYSDNKEIAKVYLGNKLVFENLAYVWLVPTEKNGTWYSIDGIHYSKLRR